MCVAPWLAAVCAFGLCEKTLGKHFVWLQMAVTMPWHWPWRLLEYRGQGRELSLAQLLPAL